MTKIEPAYLLLGPEEGEKSRFIGKITQAITSRLKEEPEEHKFYTFETEMKHVISLLRHGSLFSSYKIVILSGCEEIKRQDEISLLLDYLKNPRDDTTLILKSGAAKTDKRIESAFKGDSKRVFWELFEDQKKGWIIRYLKEADLCITRDAVDLLLEMIENNTRDLKNECDKFIFFFPAGTEITSEQIEQYIYHSKEENVFTLFDTLMEKDLDSALQIVQKLLLSREYHPVQILGGLLWQFKNLLSLNRLLHQQYSQQDAFTKLKIRWKRSRKTYSQGSRNYSLKGCERIIVLLAEYDALLRQSKTDTHQLLLSLFLYYCITGKHSRA